jgi:tetratricopeptide (TPR) repeat protein
MKAIRVLVVITTLVTSSCARTEQVTTDSTAAAPAAAEATSLLGQPLQRRSFSSEQRTTLEANLAAARAAYERAPQDADSIIWLGRRQAYLEQYRDAIQTFTDGIALHPSDARLYRHRGHRYITVRDFDNAIADLEKAAELVKGTPDETEPDGAPNARNIPTSTTQGNIWYHLALAYYLKGDYEKSLAAWQEAMRLASNDDTRVAVSDWLYMTLRRLGRHDEANAVLRPITASLDIIENTAYHRRLLMYKGEIAPDSLLDPNAEALQYVTQGYGVANWYLANGDTTRAREIMDRLLQSGYWAAFGYIAAESDIANNRVGPARADSSGAR